jgi:hypothetical protein
MTVKKIPVSGTLFEPLPSDTKEKVPEELPNPIYRDPIPLPWRDDAYWDIWDDEDIPF